LPVKQASLHNHLSGFSSLKIQPHLALTVYLNLQLFDLQPSQAQSAMNQPNAFNYGPDGRLAISEEHSNLSAPPHQPASLANHDAQHFQLANIPVSLLLCKRQANIVTKVTKDITKYR
jgi:hypothetical protein